MEVERDNNRKGFAKTQHQKITINKKLNMEQCKKILNQNGKRYSDEQVSIIRDFIYAMAAIDYLFFTEQYLNNKNINQENNYEQESHCVCPSQYRRAS